jgi:predicted small integral membrane protein
MLDRNLKAIFTALLGLMALFYVLQNLVNIGPAYASFDYVLGQADHEAYPGNLLPALGPPVSRVAAWIVFLGEFAAAGLCLYGAYRMWALRKADAAVFAASKRFAKMGAAAAAIVWFGFFHVFGGAAYQMWQTELGAGSFEGAAIYATFALLILIYLGQSEEASV